MIPPSRLEPAEIATLSARAEKDFLDLGFVGDILLQKDTLELAGAPAMSRVGEEVWAPLSSCRLIVANLEAPVTSRSTPVEDKPYIHRMSHSALGIFDHRCVLSLANNHVMDFGAEGLADTIAALDAAGLRHAGAGMNLDQARAPCRVDLGGVRVAVICAADPRFNPATETSPGTYPARTTLLVDSIQRERERCDLIVVSLHMGLEHVSAPSAAQIALARACLHAGARVVHFHHAHCLGGAATDGRGIVLFGTGNYVNASSVPIVVPSSRRTAAWRVSTRSPADGAPALTVQPCLLDDTGLPRPLRGSDAEREVQRIRSCSRHILSAPARHWTRVRDMLRPAFLRINFYNYQYLLRRRGPLFALRTLVGGLRTQFFSRAD